MRQKLGFLATALCIVLGGAVLSTSVHAQEGEDHRRCWYLQRVWRKIRASYNHGRLHGQPAQRSTHQTVVRECRPKTHQGTIGRSVLLHPEWALRVQRRKNETDPRQLRYQSGELQRAGRTTAICDGQEQRSVPCPEQIARSTGTHASGHHYQVTLIVPVPRHAPRWKKPIC